MGTTFDCKRSFELIDKLDELFGEGNYEAEILSLEDQPFIRVTYQNVRLDFKCYKYC